MSPQEGAMTLIEPAVSDVPTEVSIPAPLIPAAERQETATPQQLYQQAMENIWDKVNQLPEGQDKVVMCQLWELGKASTALTPRVLPALAAHGFILEQLDQGHISWKPYSPYLKDFWRVAIISSPTYGYRLRSWREFQARLQAAIQMWYC